MERKTIDFLKDLKTRGCPVCNHLNEAVLDFFSQWLHDLVNREEAQDRHAADLGFCPAHTWQLEASASARGISAGYPALLERLARKLSEIKGSSADSAEGVERLIQRTGRCRICNLVSHAEKAYIGPFATFLRKKAGREAYAQSQGVCLHHLVPLLSSLSDDETAGFLLSRAALRLNEAAADMKNYVRKRDSLERHLLTRDEKDAYFRALIHLAGARGIVRS